MTSNKEALEALDCIERTKSSTYDLSIKDIFSLDSRTDEYIIKLGIFTGINIHTIRKALKQADLVEEMASSLNNAIGILTVYSLNRSEFNKVLQKYNEMKGESDE